MPGYLQALLFIREAAKPQTPPPPPRASRAPLSKKKRKKDIQDKLYKNKRATGNFITYALKELQ